MKRHFLACLLLMLAATLAACSRQAAGVESDRASLPRETGHVAVSTGGLASQGDGGLEAEGTDGVEKASPGDGPDGEASVMEEKTLVLSVNGVSLNVNWENNETVDELAACAQDGGITVNATRYGGFEQVGSLPRGFSSNDVQITTVPGDIVLYSGDQLVLFFGSNTWSYTKLGHIEGLSESALSELLGGSSATVQINVH